MNWSRLPDVQARRGRVEAAVVGDRPLGERGAQRVLVGALGDQPAPVQLVDHVVRSRGHHPARRGPPATACRPAGTRSPTARPVSQNRHGRSVARLMPDPRAGATPPAGAGPPVQPHGRARRRAGRCRWSSRPMASAWVSRAGPAGQVAGRPGGRTAGRAPAPPPPRPRRRAAAPPTPSPSGPHDDVGAPVHAVGEVDVEPPGRPEHDRRARRRPAVGVRRRVVPRAGVRLDLGQPERDRALRPVGDHPAAEQRPAPRRRPARAGPPR